MFQTAALQQYGTTMDRYVPKHVELTPMHQQTISAATSLCISLECIYIAKNDTRTFQCQVQ